MSPLSILRYQLRLPMLVFCFSTTLFIIYGGYNLLHWGVRDGHIDDMTTLHDSCNDRLQWTESSIDLQFQPASLCLEDVYTCGVQQFLVNRGRRLDAQTLLAA